MRPYVDEWLRDYEGGKEHGPQIRARQIVAGDFDERGYYVTRDYGMTWDRVHKPTFILCRWIEKKMQS